MALSGARVSEDKPLDGVNLIPFLKGEGKGNPDRAIYLRQFDRNRFAVREGMDKMVITWKGAKPQLYNLKVDIGETIDLAEQRPERIEELQKLRKSWNAQLIEPTFLGLIHRPKNGKKKANRE